MLYKYKLVCFLVIFGIFGNINNIQAGDGKGGVGILVMSGAGCSIGTLLFLLGKEAYSYFSTKSIAKNVTPNSVILTAEEIEFQKVQHFLNTTKLIATDNDDHLKSDFNEFLKLARNTNNKAYTFELSRVVLNCMQNDSKDLESRYEHYSRCLEHANGLAAEKKITQTEPELTDKISETDSQN